MPEKRRTSAPSASTRSRRAWSRLLAAMATAAAASMAVAGCGHHPGAAVLEVPAPIGVDAAPVRRVASPIGEEIVGTVRTRASASIAPSVMGTVREMKVTLGSRVKAGDVLARLSAAEIDAKARQADAVWSQASLSLGRAKELRAHDSISQAEFDQVSAQHRVAEAAHAEAAVMQGYTVLRAPFAGVVTAKLGDVGDLAVPGHPLLTLEDPSALRLEATLPEAAAVVSQGKKFHVRLDAVGKDVEATVGEVSPAADPSSRTVLVKLDLPPVPELRPGIFGRLVLSTGERRSLQVPARAVVRRGQLELVYVVADHAAHLRLVRTGRAPDDAVEILSGLEEGEQVVTSEIGRLTDGSPVEVRR